MPGKRAATDDPRIESASLDMLLSMRHPANPKAHDVEELVRSFLRFGFVAYPTVDERTMVLVAGHGRCEALALMRSRGEAAPRGVRDVGGDWLVPAIRGVSFESDVERDAYLVADNANVMRGGWNVDGLRAMLDDIRARTERATAHAFDGMAFDLSELDDMAANAAAAVRDAGAQIGSGSRPAGPRDAREAKAAAARAARATPIAPLPEDDVPAPPKKPVTRPGDVWRLGDHVLVCGSASEVDPDRVRIGDVGFGFTSPPYNAASSVCHDFTNPAYLRVSRYADTDDNMDDDEYAGLLRQSTDLMMKSCRVVVVNLQSLANNKRVIARWVAAMANHLVDRAIWVKTNCAPMSAANVLTSAFEDLYIYSPKNRPNRAIETANFRSTVRNVHEGQSASSDNDYSDVHNATMPVHLAQYAIDVLGNRADFVVDPFGGTGTTLVVAHQLGKRAALVEISPAYCDVIVERWQKISGGKATRG